MVGLKELDVAGHTDLLSRLESFLERVRTGDAEARRFASNLADDGHWEDLDTLKLYVERLLEGAEAGLSLADNARIAYLAVIDECQSDGREFPHPGDMVSDAPDRLCHVFYANNLRAQLQAHEREVMDILMSPLIYDAGRRAALADYEDTCVRPGDPSRPPYGMAWATFDEAGGEHPFDDPAYTDGAGVLAADKVVTAVGLDCKAGKEYVLARYSSADIGEVRMPTVCDGRDWKNFKVCGRTDPGGLGERLHRPLRIRDLDRPLIPLAKA